MSVALLGKIGPILQNSLGRLTSPSLVKTLAEPAFHAAGRRAHPGRIDLQKVRSVLVVRTDEIGDLILTTPLLRELRSNLPHAHIALLVKPGTYDLVQYCPYINEVVRFDGATSPTAWQYAQPGRHRHALQLAAASLWPRRFDLALVPRWDTDYNHAAFLAYFSGAPWRLGYSRHVSPEKFRRNDGLDHLLTHLLHDPLPKHEVQPNLDLLRFLGGTVGRDHLELWLSHDDRQFAQNYLPTQSHQTCIAIALGAGHPKRIWPPARFAEVAHILMRQHALHIVLVGAKTDRPLVEQFLAALPPESRQHVHDAVGQTPLRQTAALLARCRLFIGNDSGPTHLAAAMQTPCLQVSCHPTGGDPIHYNSPMRFRPWGVISRVIQPPQVGGAKGGGGGGDSTLRAEHPISLIASSAVTQSAMDILAEIDGHDRSG